MSSVLPPDSAHTHSANPDSAYEVIAVRYATRQTRRSEVFLHYDVYGEPDAPAQMDYFFWVARNAARTILIDCGFNSDSGGRRPGRTMLCPPDAAVARLGIAPEDVSLLIATHGHYDHIGNLDAFPAAEIVISPREYDFWTGPLGAKPLFAISAEADDIAALRRARAAGRIRFTAAQPAADGEQVTDGVSVIEVGGHTPGQLIVLVDGTDGDVVLASDAVHYYDEVRLDRPFLHTADLPAMYSVLEQLGELTAGGTHTLVAGHDPEVMDLFPALDPAALDPGLAVRIGKAG